MIVNPCDPCAWNAVVIERQLHLVLHTDDALIAHVRPQSKTHDVKKLDKAMVIMIL